MAALVAVKLRLPDGTAKGRRQEGQANFEAVLT
jgi:hypothetical protein